MPHPILTAKEIKKKKFLESNKFAKKVLELSISNTIIADVINAYICSDTITWTQTVEILVMTLIQHNSSLTQALLSRGVEVVYGDKEENTYIQ